MSVFSRPTVSYPSVLDVEPTSISEFVECGIEERLAPVLDIPGHSRIEAHRSSTENSGVNESEVHDPHRFVEDKIRIECSVVDICGDHPKLVLTVVFEMLFNRGPRAKTGAVSVVDPHGGASELTESIAIEPSEIDIVHYGLRIEGLEFHS